MHPEEQPPAPDKEEKFHIWRLLGIIFLVCVPWQPFLSSWTGLSSALSKGVHIRL